MKQLIFITGASGAGKTATVKALEAERPTDIIFCYFDTIGVPPREQMVKDFGSGETWQRQKTVGAHEIRRPHGQIGDLRCRTSARL
jgi:hypothetical protein